ncbi:hypothetical protein ACQ4LE_006421 [Meloidogyne hapla]
MTRSGSCIGLPMEASLLWINSPTASVPTFRCTGCSKRSSFSTCCCHKLVERIICTLSTSTRRSISWQNEWEQCRSLFDALGC